MKKTVLYKYINLLARIAIGILAVWFIYDKLKVYSKDLYTSVYSEPVNMLFLTAAATLLVLNWGIETLKWQFLIRRSVNLFFFPALKIVFAAISLGFITPNRIGDIPARAYLLNRPKHLKDLVIQTSVGAYAQLIITLLFGSLAGFFSFDLLTTTVPSYFKFGLLFISGLMVWSFFYQKAVIKLLYKIKYIGKRQLFLGLEQFKREELLYVLFLCALRYLVFFLQFYLVLKAFQIELHSPNELLLIPICFMVASAIPTIIISEIGVRGSVALIIFGSVSSMDVQIILSSVILWFINVAVPALIGLIGLGSFKLFKEN